MWQSFDQGHTIGTSGSESGVILLDEEHAGGARITLERDGYAPFAVTCGVYGWMVHTRFFNGEDEARRGVETMKQGLDSIVRSIPFDDNPARDQKLDAAEQMIRDFVEQHR